MGASNFETKLRTPTLESRVQLPLGWNTYLFFNSDIMNFVWETDDGKAKSIVLLIFALWWYFHCCQMRSGVMGRKILFRAI